ncbi:hypothetical protein [Burkholderia ubonensis]|uniref:hypothetical protein n=1 Tax=Burkholderia ubonensis TaxID=101571 RepID=UPI0018DF439B|nr:hypothetical protein [Burkholderia ubonensis]
MSDQIRHGLCVFRRPSPPGFDSPGAHCTVHHLITDSRKFSPYIRTALVADLWRTPVARGIDRLHLL